MTVSATFSNRVFLGEEVHTIINGGHQRCLVIGIDGKNITLQYTRKPAFEKEVLEEVVRNIKDLFILK